MIPKAIMILAVSCALLHPSLAFSQLDCPAGTWLELANAIIQAGEARPYRTYFEGMQLIQEKPAISPRGCEMLRAGFARLTKRGCSFEGALQAVSQYAAQTNDQYRRCQRAHSNWESSCRAYFYSDQEALKARGLLLSMKEWLEICGSR